MSDESIMGCRYIGFTEGWKFEDKTPDKAEHA
jgi:hypothetical protein